MTNTSKNLRELTKQFGAVKKINQKAYNEISDMAFTIPIIWQKNTDKDADIFHFKANINSHLWQLRINDFPDEPMYTLFIDNKAILTFDDLPNTWTIDELTFQSITDQTSCHSC